MIASKVYSKASSAENLHAAFRKTGIYPFDPSGISNECVKPAEVYGNDTSNTIHMAVENNNLVSIEYISYKTTIFV
jgi:hypothetical protein